MQSTNIIASRVATIPGRIRAYVGSKYSNFLLRDMILATQSRKHIAPFLSDNKRFIVFLVPGQNIVNGGIMSICSIASETKKLLGKHGVSVAVCTAYGEPRILRYTKFENDAEILAFSDLLSVFPNGSEILVHVPELFLKKYISDRISVFQSRPDLKWAFNILLQNNDRMPQRKDVDILKQIGTTTATLAYSVGAAEIATNLGCPVHFLSWFICPEDFERVGYSRKENIVVISPDSDPAKKEIVRRISETLPDHKIIEIRNMSYQKYKDVIKRAKFSFTFGEGLDGYFVEPIFTGGVGMAIYNDRFFTPEYHNLDGVFSDGDRAIAEVAKFLRTTNNETRYTAINELQYRVVARTFVRNEYLDNIRDFYEKFYSGWFSRSGA